MEQAIVKFQQDELNDWVAVLSCGHTQHVRHRPPWMIREWVESEQGRQAAIGKLLQCKKCDRSEPRDIDEG